MTQWYYSDYDRNRHGPVRAEDLAMLHANGQLAPETLVWREGMSEWRPWREVMAEVVGGHAAPAPSRASFALVEDEPAPAPEPARASADPGGRNPYEVVQPAPRAHAAPADAGRNPYEVVERSPYAPPRAHVGGASTVVRDGHVVYVGFLRRFAASILDNFVTGIASYALLIPLVLLMGASAGVLVDGQAAAGLGVGFVVLMYGISIGLPALYFAWMQSSSTQASLGKMAVGVKVVRSDGSPMSFGRSLLRYLALVLTWAFTCGIGMLVSAFMTAFTARRQSLHDLICDTVVVDKYAFTDRPELQREGLDVVTIVVIALGVLLLVAIFGLGFFGAMMADAG